MAKTTNKARVKAGVSREKVPAAKKKAAAVKAVEPVTEAERRRMIAEAAYYRAERRGFPGGSSLDDWIAAEIEVDARLARG